MNRKGEINLGMIIGIFLAIVVGLILYGAITPYIGAVTLTQSVNTTFTAPSTGATVDLVGQELLSTPIVLNTTGLTVVPSTNYTIQESVSSVDGLKRISLTCLAGVPSYCDNSLTISYDYGPEGYIDSTGGRAVVGLIAIFAVLAILLIALYPSIKDNFGGM